MDTHAATGMHKSSSTAALAAGAPRGAASLDADRAGVLERPGGHRIAWWESGAKDGTPIVILHGGPGAGSKAWHRAPLDPRSWRIIQFDQRGCGHSRPLLRLEANTTEDLVGDVEALRETLGVERWAVLGGSWGSTLALAYAQSHPERVVGLLLRAVFLSRDRDIAWSAEPDGAARVRPEDFAAYAAASQRRGDEPFADAYGRLLGHPDPEVRLAGARAWADWEHSLCYMRPEGHDRATDHEALATATLEHHYLSNRCFLSEGELLERVDALSDIPGVIVHGRFDLCCAVEQAWDLHRAWPRSLLRIVENASHSAAEPDMARELAAGAERLLELVGGGRR